MIRPVALLLISAAASVASEGTLAQTDNTLQTRATVEKALKRYTPTAIDTFTTFLALLEYKDTKVPGSASSYLVEEVNLELAAANSVVNQLRDSIEFFRANRRKIILECVEDREKEILARTQAIERLKRLELELESLRSARRDIILRDLTEAQRIRLLAWVSNNMAAKTKKSGIDFDRLESDLTVRPDLLLSWACQREPKLPIRKSSAVLVE
jgi:vacuolar-type H+-ATPase subunit I/STV1